MHESRQVKYRLSQKQLLEILEGWNHYLRRKVHLIACGGTTMTLLGVKASTKDVDFMTPEIGEHCYLIKQIKKLGYSQVTHSGWERPGELFRFDLFSGNRIHTTELLESPLGEGRHTRLIEFSRLHIGILNDYDLIASKLMRGTQVDFDDCLMLTKAHREKLDIDHLVEHYREMVSYDVSEQRIGSHIDLFIKILKENNLYG